MSNKINILSILRFLSKNRDNYIINDDYLKNLPENFIPDNNKLLIDNIKLNHNYLNINIVTKLSGKVSIDNELIDTFIYKNVQVVNNGDIIRPELQLELKDVYKKLIKNGLMKTYPDNRELLENLLSDKLDLNGLDIFDYNHFLQYDLDKLINLRLDILSLEANNKVLKYLSPYNENKSEIFNRDGSMKYFSSSGKRETNNRELFTIDIKGISSLPSIDKVIEKVNDGKQLTLRENIINDIYNIYKNSSEQDILNEYENNIKILEYLRNIYMLSRASREILDKPFDNIDNIHGSYFDREIKIFDKKYNFKIKVNPLTHSFKEQDIDISI